MLVVRLVWPVPRLVYLNFLAVMVYPHFFDHLSSYVLITYPPILQAYTSQIVAMAMMALAIGSDQISTQARRNAIFSGLTSLPSKLHWIQKFITLPSKMLFLTDAPERVYPTMQAVSVKFSNWMLR
jgi:hypothetical protein